MGMNRLQAIGAAVARLGRDARSLARAIWSWYRSLSKRLQIVIAVVLVILIIAGFALARSGGPADDQSSLRAVSLSSVGMLASAGQGSTVVGSVRALAEAEVLAKTSGTVESVNTSLGASVPAGYVIASLENARERAAVLQAEGSYDAAVAARRGTSSEDVTVQARNAYQSAYTDIDTSLEADVDTFYGEATVYGPRFLIFTGDNDESVDFAKRRAQIRDMMRVWQGNLEGVASREPEALLDEAEGAAQTVSMLLVDIAREANKTGSNASAAQLAALSSARADVDGALSAISSARSAFRAGSVGADAGADATVKQALGALRAAEANLEQTVIRAPIAGTVNFLPIRRGDYVTALTHAATVAQNNALEVITYVSESDRAALAVGMEVMVQDTYPGLVTAIAPALDPVTKQIELRIAVESSSGLVNGESVRLTLPGLPETVEETSGPVLLPLASVKLRAHDRVVFTVDAENRLVAHPVETGTVRGGKIEILSTLSGDLAIVTDARGLAEGERVTVIETP